MSAAVWVVRVGTEVEAAFPREHHAIDYMHRFGTEGMAVTRESLLTPEHERVIAAAKAHAEIQRSMEYGNDELIDALDALRVQEGA